MLIFVFRMDGGSKKCRICMQETFTGIISLQIQIPCESGTYAEIYESISGLTPDKGSQYLCKSCTEDLLSSYEFKKRVERCEKVWGVEIKLETDFTEGESQPKVTEIEVKPDAKALVFVSTLISEVETIPAVKSERIVEDDDYHWQSASDDDSMKQEDDDINETCPYCQGSYSTRARLEKHCKNVHKGAKMSCLDCQKEFAIPHLLAKHRRKKHGDSDIEDKYELTFPAQSDDVERSNKTYECPFCSEIFSAKSRLATHKKQQHPGQKPAKKDPNEQTICPECGLMIYVRALERHRRTAHDATPRETFICDLCNARLVSKVGMNIHMQLKHLNTTFFCRHCTENFPTPGIRRTHEIRFHTKNYKHLCHLCDKKFITGVHLRKHLNSHTGEKKFPCETCGMRLSTKDGLKRHMATHSGMFFLTKVKEIKSFCFQMNVHLRVRFVD